MSDLTPGASMAWQIAALETDGSGHEKIERGHLLIGLLSLEKFRASGPAEKSLAPDLLAALRQEIALIDEALRRARAEAAWLRRRLRECLATGDVARGRRSISRSEGCKRAFVRAGELAQGGSLSSLHLLGALTAEPDAPLLRVLAERGLDAAAIGRAAPRGNERSPSCALPSLDPEAIRRIVRPMLDALVAAVRERHAVELVVSPEAEAFLGQAGFSADPGGRQMERTLERLVQAPLSSLVLSGKLSRHPVWRLVYDEGGVYLLPAEAGETR